MRVAEAKENYKEQPDSIITRLPTGDEIFMSHYRVSDRVPRSMLTVVPAELLYHELDAQVDPGFMRDLDEPLYLKDKLRDVYNCLARSMNDDFLAYTPIEVDADLIPKCATSLSQAANVFNSKCIKNSANPQFSRVILNKDLYVPTEAKAENSKELMAKMVSRSFYCVELSYLTNNSVQ